MPRPKLLGIEYAASAKPTIDEWRRDAGSSRVKVRSEANARLRSLATFESRVRSNPLGAGDPVARDRRPRDLARDYGADVPNLFRFELAGRWRGYYSLVGEAGGVRVWVLLLWDRATFDRQSGYGKK